MPAQVPLPEDENKRSIPLTMARRSRAKTVLTGLSTAQSVTLNNASGFVNTVLIEVNALAQPLYMRYLTASVTGAVTSANFDEFIQPGGVRHYVVPNGVTGLSFLEQAASATAIVIEK